jgi:hypothetical protein
MSGGWHVRSMEGLGIVGERDDDGNWYCHEQNCGGEASTARTNANWLQACARC